MNINKKNSSPYRPQTNGLIERTNRTIIGILSKTVFNQRKKWDDHLDLVKFNYNIRYQNNIRCSPFELIYGRKVNLPYFDKAKDRQELTIDRITRIQENQHEVMNERRKEQKKTVKEIPEKAKIHPGDVILYKTQLNKKNLIRIIRTHS